MNKEDNPIAHRWEQWRLANSKYSGARRAEIQKIFTLLKPQPGEKIWEAGTGNGNLTLPLAEAVLPLGGIVTTDVQPGNTEEVRKLSEEKNLPVTALLLPLENSLLPKDEYGGQFDAVASIATLHHFDSRLDGAGEAGRINALQTFYDMLEVGGRLVLSDVLEGSLAQRYFDVIDDPIHAAPHGHPYDFFTKERLIEILKEVGFTNITFELASTPWEFTSKEEAAMFVHTLHNAQCSVEESFEIASRMLGWEENEGLYTLGWDLFFVTAQK